jgi:hypothetical protein
LEVCEQAIIENQTYLETVKLGSKDFEMVKEVEKGIHHLYVYQFRRPTAEQEVPSQVH